MFYKKKKKPICLREMYVQDLHQWKGKRVSRQHDNIMTTRSYVH